jgi:hypothetical protein
MMILLMEEDLSLVIGPKIGDLANFQRASHGIAAIAERMKSLVSCGNILSLDLKLKVGAITRIAKIAIASLVMMGTARVEQ